MNIRNNKQISPKETLSLSVKANSSINYQQYELMIKKLANVSQVDVVTDKINGAISFLVATDEFFVPFAENIDPKAEAERLQKEKEYLLGFLKSVNAKLLNERFMANAKPEIIEVEQRKKADAEAKLKILEESLAALAI
jgi:valyl-tRNA synthetase